MFKIPIGHKARPSELPVTHMYYWPTICVGQASDLKLDTGKYRYWLARCGPDDGNEGFPIEVEELIDGRWETIGGYGNWHHWRNLKL